MLADLPALEETGRKRPKGETPMNPQLRTAVRNLLLAVLLGLTCLAVTAAPAAAWQGDTSLAHIDGYLSISPDGRCMVLKQHDGSLLTLFGRRRGLVNNDHLRLEGRLVAGNGCGGQGGFEITKVQTVWADDNHRSTYYDHLKNGDFVRWVEQNRPQALAERRYRDHG
jgi:hypothetical protein